MRLILENRSFIAFHLGACIGLALFWACPFPGDDPMLRLILAERPAIYYGFKWAYCAMLFSTPCAALAMALSFTYIFAGSDSRVS